MRLILIAVILHFTRHGIVFPFIPLLSEKMGAGPTTIGFIVGAFSLIAVFLSIPIGGLVDRFGVQRLLVFGVICNIANAVILLQTDTVFKLIAAQLIAGIAFLLHVVASQTFISRIPDASRREKGFGWLSFGGAAGLSLGPILGGILVDHFDYQAAFWVVLVLSSGGLILLGLKNTRDTDPTSTSYSPLRDARQAVAMAGEPKVMVMISDLTNPTRSGLAMGLRFTAIMLAGLLSPIILGFIIESFGLSPAFYAAALVVVMAGIWMFFIRPDLIPGRRL